MAVRRVSDLPNLDVIYPQSQLSNCLVEVSYAQPIEPRRYQSFYENGDSFATRIAKYIGNLNFLTIDDLSSLGIGDLADLVNMLNSLLNTEDLYLFVAQCGVPYNAVASNSEIRYDTVELRNNGNSRLGKTLVWKNNPIVYDSSFSSKYYAANKHDIVFFKTVYDAMKIAQRFKFLDGAGINIKICTDLVEPLNVRYSVNSSNQVNVETVTPKDVQLAHSDTCQLDIEGTKINSLTRVYDRTSKKLDHCKMSMSSTMRTIFRDTYSLYSARDRYAFSSQIPTTYRYLVFDGGTNYSYDSLTYGNQCIQNLAYQAMTVNCIAFMHYDRTIAGNKMTIANCSFNKCAEGILATGGGRTVIEGSIEMLDCDTAIISEEASTLLRNRNTAGNMYVKCNNPTAKFGYSTMNGIDRIEVALDFEPNRQVQFISADTKSSYISSDWRYVPFNDMSSYINNHANNLTVLQKFAVNTSFNGLIVDTSDDRAQLIYGDSPADLSEFLIKVTGNTISNTPTSNAQYSGPTTMNSFIDFRTDIYQQTVITYSNLYQDYETSRFNVNSRLRSACAFSGNSNLTMIWDYPYYRERYQQDGQLTSNVSENKFTVTVQNDPESTSTSYTYNILDGVFNINPSGYSLKNYRRTAPSGSNYSFNTINYNNEFRNLMDSMQTKYGYTVIKTN